MILKFQIVYHSYGRPNYFKNGHPGRMAECQWILIKQSFQNNLTKNSHVFFKTFLFYDSFCSCFEMEMEFKLIL